MAKTLEEIRQIAIGRRSEGLAGLSCPELHVLLSAMNKLKVPLSEEPEFVQFYLKVAGMIQNCRRRKRRLGGGDEVSV
jgi:hypothetical protein